MPTSPRLISFAAVRDKTSCGFIVYHYCCSFSFKMLDLTVNIKYLQIHVVQSVLSNVAGSKANKLTCKLSTIIAS